MKKWLQYFLVFLLAFTLSGCGASPESAEKTGNTASSGKTLDAARSEDEENPKIDESSQESDDIPHQTTSDEDSELQEDGVYTSRDEVAQYIFTYGHLPSNFITKKEAKALGWEGGGLEPYAPGKCIGGSRFGNYEGLLPEKEGRVYTECDIDTLGADRRGAKRIVFSNDGLIYYTEDHYESFELLYGEE
ncbi:ribonuclease [Schaedlerella arabinosiphila]|uniref:Ribonuclease n=2 Tax=Lachnospiraceae TaxID=186803 RepID=A0A9X5CFZ0_9FIRM|nr:ribonuclease [Lachnospiraceae bacterium]NDO71286.1 ribonuclease [Schaedlerella arabinosiphila]